jgi:hypothetical protein
VAFGVAEVVDHAPVRERQQPTAKGAALAVVLKLRHPPGHRSHGFLHYILRVAFIQAGLERKIENQFPVRFKKIVPRLLILQILEPHQQRAASPRKFILRGHHLVIKTFADHGGNLTGLDDFVDKFLNRQGAKTPRIFGMIF